MSKRTLKTKHLKAQQNSARVQSLEVAANPYGRLLSTGETAEEIGYNVTEYKLRVWRMDKDHPLAFYKKGSSDQGHCFYKWEDIQAFKQLIRDGGYIP